MKVLSWPANVLRFDTLSCKSPAAMQLSYLSSSKTFNSEVLRQAIALSVLFWLACIVIEAVMLMPQKNRHRNNRQDNTTTKHGSVKYNYLDRLGTIPQEDFQALLSLDTRPDTESNKLKQSRILLPLFSQIILDFFSQLIVPTISIF